MKRSTGKVLQLDYDQLLGLSPAGQCIQISERTLAMLLAQTDYLHWHTRYYSPSGSPIDQNTIDEWASHAEKELMLADPCLAPGCDEDTGCIEYLPTSAFIRYLPQDPFQTPSYTPPGYIQPPFIAGSAYLPILGYRPTDAIIDFPSFPFLDLPALISNGLPRISIPFTGGGEVELELLKVVQGGLAYISIDGLPGQFVDLNSFTLGDIDDLQDALTVVFEGGLLQSTIIELDVDGAGAHEITITFLPFLSADVLLLRFGGGFRRVSLCGSTIAGTPDMAEFRTIDDGCTLQTRPSPAHEWVTIAENICGAAGAAGGTGATGGDGRTPEFRVVTVDADTTDFQWKYTDEDGEIPGVWRHLDFFHTPADGADGADGRTPEFRVVTVDADTTDFQWKYEDEDGEIPGVWRHLDFFHTPADGAPGTDGADCENCFDVRCGSANAIARLIAQRHIVPFLHYIVGAKNDSVDPSLAVSPALAAWGWENEDAIGLFEPVFDYTWSLTVTDIETLYNTGDGLMIINPDEVLVVVNAFWCALGDDGLLTTGVLGDAHSRLEVAGLTSFLAKIYALALSNYFSREALLGLQNEGMFRYGWDNCDFDPDECVETETWTRFWDFTSSDGGWEVAGTMGSIENGFINTGEWVDGFGWSSLVHPDESDMHIIHIRRDVGRVLLNAEVHNIVNGFQASWGVAWHVKFNLSGGSIEITDPVLTDGESNPDVAAVMEDINEFVVSMEIFAVAEFGATVVNAFVHGVGDSPF